MENSLYRLLAAARWLLLVFYGGLAVALLAFAVSFLHHLVGFVANVGHMEEVDSVLAVLGLIDGALIAGLIVMVMLSGFGNFLARPQDTKTNGLSQIPFAALKTKFAATIAAIATIDTLETLFETSTMSLERVLIAAIPTSLILLAVLVFALVDRMSGSHDAEPPRSHGA